MKMNAMHMDAPFPRIGGDKKIFFVLRLDFGAFWVHPCASGLFCLNLGAFLSVISYLSVFWMHQMHMDEPLVYFWRFFVSPSFEVVQTMHPCQGGRVHPGTFSSLKKGRLR